MNGTKVLIALVAGVMLIAAQPLTRSGYSVDEEFTVFAVRGIQAHGLPILPSGLLYDRGILYSYASWLAGAVSGSELPVYRAVSLIAAAIALWLVFKLVSRLASESAGVIAAGLVAASVPFWATATTARFYAPFLAIYMAALLSLRHAPLAFVVACLARLTHELAFTLALVPAVCWAIDRDDRRAWLRSTVAVVTGLLAAQLLILGLHALSPTTGDTMVRRFFLWQVFNLFERPGDRQFAIPLVVMVIAWLAAPKRAWINAVVALSISAAIVAFSIAQASNDALLNADLIKTIASEGSRYPLDMFWHIARVMPVSLLIAMALLAYRLRGDWPLAHRAAHALWIGWVLWFGVIESGITTNYLLLPVALMSIAIAIDVTAVRLHREVIAGIVTIVAVAQFRTMPLEAARPTITTAGIDEIRHSLQPDDRIVCTDELGCLMLVGRIDRWLALDDYVRERFLVRRGDEPVTGVYTGVPAVFRPADVFSPNADGTLPERILIVDIFKEYPIGNSRSWLPKAIEQDGVPVTPLLETSQFRVLLVAPPERVVLRQPSP